MYASISLFQYGIIQTTKQKQIFKYLVDSKNKLFEYYKYNQYSCVDM